MADPNSSRNGHTKSADERFKDFARENDAWDRKMGDVLRELDESLEEDEAPARDAEPA